MKIWPRLYFIYWPGELGTPTDWPKYGGVNGASWSKFIGEKVDGLPDLMQCKGLCFFRECHYLVYHGSSCYLGDFGVTASVIDTQAESRDAYIYDGKMIRTSGGIESEFHKFIKAQNFTFFKKLKFFHPQGEIKTKCEAKNSKLKIF